MGYRRVYVSPIQKGCGVYREKKYQRGNGVYCGKKYQRGKKQKGGAFGAGMAAGVLVPTMLGAAPNILKAIPL